MAEQVNVNPVPVEQRHDGGVDVNFGAGNDISNIGDRDMDVVREVALNEERFVLATDPA